MKYLELEDSYRLKELGYPQEKKSGMKFFSENEKCTLERMSYEVNGKFFNEEDSYVSPTYEEVYDWIRNVKKYDILVEEIQLGTDDVFVGYTYSSNDLNLNHNKIYNTKEECLENLISFSIFRMININKRLE